MWTDGQKDVTKLVGVFRDYANAWFNMALWSNINFITAVPSNMSHLREKQTEWRVTASKNGTWTFTKPRYRIGIFIESEHVALLCASKRGEKKPWHSLLTGCFIIPEFPLIHWRVFLTGHPLRLLDVAVHQKKKDKLSVAVQPMCCVNASEREYNLCCNWWHASFHLLSYDTTGCVLLNYLCFAGNWNPARTKYGFRLIPFLVIWAR